MQDWLFVNLILCPCSGYGTGLSNSPVPTACCCCCLFSTCTLRSSLAILSLKYFAIFSHRRRGKRKMKQFTVISSRSHPNQRKGAHAQGSARETWKVLSLSKPRGLSRMEVSFPEQRSHKQRWCSWPWTVWPQVCAGCNTLWGTVVMVLWAGTVFNLPGLWQGSVLTLAQAPAALPARPFLGFSSLSQAPFHQDWLCQWNQVKGELWDTANLPSATAEL